LTAKILDGKALAEEIRREVATGVAEMKQKHGVTPGLAAVLVGDDPASAIYVRNKGRACQEAGIFSETFRMPADTSQSQISELLNRLNDDPRFHGILVQLPLPDGIDEGAAIETVATAKDIDGIHPFNLGKLLQGSPVFIPGTPAGIQQLLVRNGYDPAGKHVVICGRSNIVGKPLALLLLREHCTVTLCHSKTRDLSEISSRADILVAAVGRPEMIRGDWIKPGATVIDVGINRLPGEDGKSKLVGDVAFDEAVRVAGAITPVPGGVGPMTIAGLLRNTLIAACRRRGLSDPDI